MNRRIHAAEIALKCRRLARSRRSAAAGFRSAYRRLTDLRGRMSVQRRIPDLAPKGSEGRFMTQSVNREFFDLDRFGLVSLPYPGLETIRNQTLSKAIAD